MLGPINPPISLTALLQPFTELDLSDRMACHRPVSMTFSCFENKDALDGFPKKRGQTTQFV